MAETKRMTAEQAVGFLLEEESLDFLRESLTGGAAAIQSSVMGAFRGGHCPTFCEGDRQSTIPSQVAVNK